MARNLDEDVAKDLKGKKFILLKGEESLDENGQVALERIKAISSDLTDAYILKERLRTIWPAFNRHQKETLSRSHE